MRTFGYTNGYLSLIHNILGRNLASAKIVFEFDRYAENRIQEFRS